MAASVGGAGGGGAGVSSSSSGAGTIDHSFSKFMNEV